MEISEKRRNNTAKRNNLKLYKTWRAAPPGVAFADENEK
jgi:hypothetical protein